ncbi:MAG: hypothetical protein V2A58_15675 [Planctomycetota bacterium]
MRIPPQGHVDFEGRARLSANFLEGMIDRETGQPYFNVMDTRPTSAVHDWADFVDLAARYYEGALLAREVTGEGPANIEVLKRGFLKRFEGETGLFYRPKGVISTHCADLFDQSRALIALGTWVQAEDGEESREYAGRMVEGLLRASVREGNVRFFRPGLCGHRGAEDASPSYGVGPLIRPLLKLGEVLGKDEAIELAEGLTRLILERTDTFSPEGAFRDHTHSRLGTAAGIFEAGRMTGRREWKEFAYGIWRHARKLGTSFGFLPEFAGGEQPPTTCETCALMDYADLMLVLAGDEHGELWDEVDRLLRNHLIESQYVRADWGRGGTHRGPTELTDDEEIPERMVGGFAGWASATDLFGLTPRSSEGWLVPGADRELYLVNNRVAQNCCGPSGMKALYLIWSKAIERSREGWRVHLAVSRSVPGLCVKAGIGGEARITVAEDGRLALRAPEGVDAKGMQVESARSLGVDERGYLLLGLAGGREARISWKPPERSVTERIGHEPYAEETVHVRYSGGSAAELASAGGPGEEEWRRNSSLWGRVQLYGGRAEGLRAEEAPPTERAVRITW